MKKRFPAFFLALVLCLGLAVPAFAANGSGAARYKLDINTPDNYTLETGTVYYQVRYCGQNGNVLAYGAPQASEAALMSVPRGVEITLSGLTKGSDVPCIIAWSDPDGDGVYDTRYFAEKDGTVSVLPLPEDGTYPLIPGVGLWGGTALGSIGYTASADGASATVSVDRLMEALGPNTIIRLFVQDEAGTSEKAAWMLKLPAFTDVPIWCAKAVDWAAGKNIAKGFGNNRFAPGNDCTRAQILTFLWRAKNEPASSATQFSGVRDYGSALNWAYENGLIDRRETYSGRCSRAAAVWFIWVAQGMPAPTKTSSFADVDYSTPNAEAINWAVENGIVEGYPDGTFRPNTVCNRGAIATMLYRAYVPAARLNAQ